MTVDVGDIFQNIRWTDYDFRYILIEPLCVKDGPAFRTFNLNSQSYGWERLSVLSDPEIYRKLA